MSTNTGGAFGELALTGSRVGQMRQATVVAAVDTHFVLLDRDAYDVAHSDARKSSAT